MASKMHASQSWSHAGVWLLTVVLCDIPYTDSACLLPSICLYAADLKSCPCMLLFRCTVHQSCYLYNLSGDLVTSVYMLLVLPRYIAAWHVCLLQAAADGRWYYFVVAHCTEGSV